MKKIRLTILAFCLSLSAFATDNKESYNLLVIQTDEHHFKTLGCYGGKIVKTPNIDWIAKNGAIATSFYATTPVCSPSRGALMSGKYPQHTPVTNNNIKLDDDIVTFAEVLRRKGYATGYAGKWHLDGDGKPQWGPKRKFGWEDNRFMFNRGHWKMFADGPNGPQVGSTKNGRPDYGIKGADEKSFATDWLTDKVINFVNEKKGKSFCYMVSYPDPHGPNTVRAPYDTMYEDVKPPIPRSVNKTRAQTPKWAAKAPRITADTIRLLMPKYYGMVKCLDDNIGRILDTLRRNGQIDNTIIVFTSDHGDLCGEHGRLNKGVPYEGSARIPFLIYTPGKIKGGTVVNEALSCIDFMPTVMNLMNTKHGQKVDGRDATALFTGVKTDWSDMAFIRSTSVSKPWLCAVSDRYKLVYSEMGDPWLFDLEKDPDELINLFNDPESKDVITTMTDQLQRYCKLQKDPFADLPEIKSAITAALGN
ncbi:MAG TPA: sulfatase [Verrucomicrobiales bacterium]|nr:sulfatase [Verrucomicrobiales bacterium]HBU60693.1 sulfatase [Verrucomicrobiales bacterium]|tara:strand:- start:1825 stop:3252 length:1428 start_codon:yes stop_codon:yes gene_type:complete